MKIREVTTERGLDDRWLWSLVRAARALQQQMGLEEPDLSAGDLIRSVQPEKDRRTIPPDPAEHYLIVIEAVDGEGYRACCPALGDCFATGDTPAAAKAELLEEMRQTIQGRLVAGEPLPLELGLVDVVPLSACLFPADERTPNLSSHATPAASVA
jgi:predicted RNase H-like HicB family nuclease